MGYQIIKERALDRFALFSSETDTFAMRDAFAIDIIDFFVEKAEDDTRKSVGRIFEKLREGQRPYYQFTLTLDEAEAMHAEHAPTRDES